MKSHRLPTASLCDLPRSARRLRPPGAAPPLRLIVKCGFAERTASRAHCRLTFPCLVVHTLDVESGPPDVPTVIASAHDRRTLESRAQRTVTARAPGWRGLASPRTRSSPGRSSRERIDARLSRSPDRRECGRQALRCGQIIGFQTPQGEGQYPPIPAMKEVIKKW